MPGLPVCGFDHCTVLITDVALARQFYGQQLGLREIAPPSTFDFIAVWYDLGGTYLHLLLKPLPDSESPRHFCLRVTDLQAAREVIRSQGIAITETVKIPGAERFFIRDPFGNRIEVLQWERPYQPEIDGRFQA
ncbi:VOC family protein [Tuwongella immobilis]|uniref:VOC domain-containing protein n=1 Tax=Tuwongella immobilis TaxID=692036 RepID=A0A6C2YTV6_9BACT|nr:VOC family protein [Tuwongella immobilis]VIP04787.1 Glyoxalase/bleomycin resistance protein/dioxygenase OS=Roseiflexus castenholzii (strain DSM 13941 / HLO8) GN=Rcas_2613 PE=4 SV=1: Glyoxalase_2 [Tuwongella immobilis]VTS06933.1 Glyoxalase/bleomycin resistance protein/dioxygenase OS=Roseiflexus castenholzii (strain DSM 13941 / HLO8) GN=Rcas_2613 PE=4 SV=1: Glyoxalase_2 [Tuwongella immobilis]